MILLGPGISAFSEHAILKLGCQHLGHSVCNDCMSMAENIYMKQSSLNLLMCSHFHNQTRVVLTATLSDTGQALVVQSGQGFQLILYYYKTQCLISMKVNIIQDS